MPSLRAPSDTFYTPSVLAAKLVEAVEVEVNLVLDPCVGDGSLLRAAEKRWPSAHLIGLDIDEKQLRRNRVSRPSWQLGKMDMLSQASRSASPSWRAAAGRVDCAIMNPPFSYRGGARVRASFGGVEHGLTPSSAFIAETLSRLGPNGELVAVLPSGITDLEKDEAFWSQVYSGWIVEPLENLSSTSFTGTRAKATLFRVRPQKTLQVVPKQSIGAHKNRLCVELLRGRVAVHLVRDMPEELNGAAFMHTSDVASSSASAKRLAPRRQATQGPILVLPRVGRIGQQHIRVVAVPEEIVLSDCLLALRTKHSGDLDAMETFLVENFEELLTLYTGPCAPSLTVRRLEAFLQRHGFCCHRVAASAEPFVAARCVDGERLKPATG